MVKLKLSWKYLKNSSLCKYYIISDLNGILCLKVFITDSNIIYRTQQDSTAITQIIEISKLIINFLVNETYHNNLSELILRLLRNICSKGTEFQDKITSIPDIFQLSTKILTDSNITEEKVVCLQCLANMCVQNKTSQEIVWSNLKNVLLEYFGNNHSTCDIVAMIIYNMFIAEQSDVLLDGEKIYKLLVLEVIDGTIKPNEFMFIFLEYFITEYEKFPDIYKSLEEKEKLWTLYHISDYLKETEKKKQISSGLLKLIVDEFKMKSDCILKTLESYVNGVNPNEICALLEIISAASSQNVYGWILKSDGSLFLNIGCLLRNLQMLGKESDNIFTPIAKIDPNVECEKEFSYDFKSKLVQIIGNLSHKNKKNQDLSREMDILVAVLESTNIDTRNPCKYNFVKFLL